MKLFHLILGIYILLLSCMPCTDTHNKVIDRNITSVISSEHTTNSHQDENCSPFCICFCCGSAAINVYMLSEIIVTEFTDNSLLESKTVKIKKVSFAIWQPPKIG